MLVESNRLLTVFQKKTYLDILMESNFLLMVFQKKGQMEILVDTNPFQMVYQKKGYMMLHQKFRPGCFSWQHMTRPRWIIKLLNSKSI